MVDGVLLAMVAAMDVEEYEVMGRSRERGGGVYILDVESEEMSDGLSGTIFSITSIVLAGETGRLPAIDLVSENWESLDIELRAVCDWPLLNKRFFETVGRTTCCSCENESRHEFRLGVEGNCGGKGVEACGRANGGATIRRGVGGVLGRE